MMLYGPSCSTGRPWPPGNWITAEATDWLERAWQSGPTLVRLCRWLNTAQRANMFLGDRAGESTQGMSDEGPSPASAAVHALRQF